MPFPVTLTTRALLTQAAYGGLQPASAGRLRGAYPHLVCTLPGAPSSTYFCSFPNTYPYRGIVYQTLDFFFLIRLDHRPIVRAGDDVADVVWVNQADLSLDEIAFASGRQALFEYCRMSI